MMQTRAFTISAQPVGDRRVRFVCSTKAVDRHGTRFAPRGCRYANYMKNPIVLWNHQKDGEPDDAIGNVVDIQITDKAVIATVEFDIAQKAQKCLRLVRRGVLRAVSIGFISLRELPPDSENVIDVLEWELCELSLVPVGSNPEALAIRSFTLRAPLIRAVAILVERADGHTLWARRRDSGKYTAPGGKLNVGESPEVGAARELKEEAGIGPTLLAYLGQRETKRAEVFCYRASVPQDTVANSAGDPDREVETWEWKAQPPSREELHHSENVLLEYLHGAARTPSFRTVGNTERRSLMDPKMILEKLGLAEGAKPEEIAAALIKYLAGADADADKVSLVVGLLGMLAPPASATSDGGEAAARDAMVEEVRRLEARLAEVEAQKGEAEKRAEPTPEERADKACKAGQWPMGQRSSLVEQYKGGKQPFLFPEKTFSTRGVRFTEGGNPTQTDSKTAPNFGSDQKAAPALNAIDKLVIGIAKRSGINLTAEQFAAQRAK